ncbi:MAG: hypothetical protein JWN23_862 [Rhodocyclales bacterium]|nr:hypothetical protein [Rhodocyclales bacterium]
MEPTSDNEYEGEGEFVVSPCIRICCLDENDVCLGCFRTLDEIKDWRAADNSTRECILQRCTARRDAHDLRFPGPPALRA